ncbi:unnamed protein product [Mucor circinelloides]
MSAFNNTSNNNTTLNQPGLDGRIQPPVGELNENHGIAATGLNEPHTHATVPTTQGTTAERRSDNLNFSGPPIAGNKVDQAGSQNPSATNRTAGTGIPPVNTAEHARHNAAEEALSGHHGHHDNHHNVGTGVGATGTAAAAAGAGHAAADKLTGDHHNTTGTGLTGSHHNTTGTGLTGDHHNTAGTGLTGSHHNTTGTGLTGDHHNTTGTGLTGSHHNTTGTGISGDHHNLTGASAVKGDHGASHHGQAAHAHVGQDATHPAGAAAAGATGGAGVTRHAGEPQHEGLLPNKHKEHHATSGNHPTTSDGVEGKASAGDKIKGNLEKMAGKITGNEAKVIAGENKAAGRT